MSKIKTIFTFEFLTLLKKKSIIVSTIFLCVFALIATCAPAIINTFFTDDDSEVVETFDLSALGYYFYDNTQSGEWIEYFAQIDDSDPSEFRVYTTPDALSEAVAAEEVDLGVALIDGSNVQFITGDFYSGSANQQIVYELIHDYLFVENLRELGINPNQVYQAMNFELTQQQVNLGKNPLQGMFVSYVFIFAIYMSVILYGSNVSTSVAREKDSRTMELLITSADTKDLIIGKVFATGLIGLLQIGCVLAVALITFLFVKNYYPPFILPFIFESVSPMILLVFIVYAVFGYFFYLFIYAALGSLVSKVEDVSSAVSPINFLFIAAYLIASLAMGMPQSLLTTVSSFVPFTSLLIMPIRNMLTEVHVIELVISLLLLLITTVLASKLSIYIYRMGSLNYGNKMKLKDILGSLFNKQ